MTSQAAQEKPTSPEPPFDSHPDYLAAWEALYRWRPVKGDCRRHFGPHEGFRCNGATGRLIEVIPEREAAAATPSLQSERLLEALRDEQQYASALSDALLRLGHHPFGYHESPGQYDADSPRACSFARCIDDLLARLDEGSATPNGVRDDRT